MGEVAQRLVHGIALGDGAEGLGGGSERREQVARGRVGLAVKVRRATRIDRPGSASNEKALINYLVMTVMKLQASALEGAFQKIQKGSEPAFGNPMIGQLQAE